AYQSGQPIMSSVEISVHSVKASSHGCDAIRRAVMMASIPIVFVVDHDVSVRDAVESLGYVAGWKVESYASASGFLARPPVAVPSCLVLDVELPDANGLDMQQRLADRAELLPIIFFTGCCDVQTAVRAMKAGAAEFLSRPLVGEVLLCAMRHAIERSRNAL